MLTILRSGDLKKKQRVSTRTSRDGLHDINNCWLDFLEITERKVSILDDYGDENWDALAKEIERLLLKPPSLTMTTSMPSRSLCLKD